MLFFFALTLFVSATLLFLVQPMVGKMVLPTLGGTPAVWNTCMVFFQAVLLVGYAFTHTVSSWPRRRQLLAQFAILGLPFLVLPFSLGEWSPPADHDPAQSVLWLLLGMVGLPFFVVTTSAPLLQRWFAATGHPAAKDPYFLYGASNLGSMLALVLYPVLVEPHFAVDDQATLWTVGYGVLALLVLGCGFIVWRQREQHEGVAVPILKENASLKTAVESVRAGEPAAAKHAVRRLGRRRPASSTLMAAASARDDETTPVPRGDVTFLRRLRWIALAAAPVSLMLGVTTYLTTDIAGIPLLWIVPLALYLLTFILVFARWPVSWIGWPHIVVLYVQPCILMVLVLVLLTLIRDSVSIGLIGIHLAAFFATALVCHGELAYDRPAAGRLTDFYLCMALGGVLGGVFNTLIAPQLFWFGVAEYYLAMVLACCLRPDCFGLPNWITRSSTPLFPGDSTPQGSTAFGAVLTLAIPLVIGVGAYYLANWGARQAALFSFVTVAALLVLALSGRSWRFGLSVGALILGVSIYYRNTDPFLFEGRGFFGFVRVYESAHGNGTVYHSLYHGGINHGTQVVEPPSRRRETLTYFQPSGGIGQVFKQFSWPDARLPTSLVGLGAVPGGLLAGIHSEPPYAVVGLGTGILAAYAKPGQHVIFYEIDPLVLRLSEPLDESEPYFYYLRDARERGANLEVILGDGRLMIKNDPHLRPDGTRRRLDSYYHIIVLDAFSSDAIPVHLLTAEAIDLYLSKLVDGGLLIFNVTNRYVELSPVLGKIAQEKSLACLYFADKEADWVVMQRKNYTESRRAASGGPPLEQRLDMKLWEPASILDGPMWTDKYTNLLRVLRL